MHLQNQQTKMYRMHSITFDTPSYTTSIFRRGMHAFGADAENPKLTLHMRWKLSAATSDKRLMPFYFRRLLGLRLSTTGRDDDGNGDSAESYQGNHQDAAIPCV
jgi:hypothetical protein